MSLKKNILTIGLILTLGALPAIGQEAPRRIAVARGADSITLHAAHELQRLLKLSGIALPIEQQRMHRWNRPRKGTIYIGTTPWTKTLDDSIAKPDSYFIVSNGCWMQLKGNGKGTLYAVYHYLEHWCHYRLYTPDALTVACLKGLQLPTDTLVERPAFDYREVYYQYPNQSQLYADWHHLHTAHDREHRWGLFVHTFDRLIPAAQYFDRHPEWFSERDGQRVRDGQLCLSNSDMIDTLCANLDAIIKSDNHRHHIWSVSNNDNYNACQCVACRRLDSLYGGPTGTLLHFVNQVARRFPDDTISTLAYQYTRSAPTNDSVRPDSNVNIMFCSIECGRQTPIASAPEETDFRHDMEQWRKLTDNIFMWDYIVQFRNYWNPFPNLHILQPNLQYFRNNGVTMIYEQGSGKTVISSGMPLRTYLTAKLLWNPDADVRTLTEDFCKGYYGAAGSNILAIIDTMTHSLLTSGQRLDIYGFPIDGAAGYLRSDRIDYYYTQIEAAYRAADSDSVLKARIRLVEMAIDFAALELYCYGVYNSFNDSIASIRTQRFISDCHRYGIEQLMEHGYTPEDFGEMMHRYAEKRRPHRSTAAPVTLRKQPTPPYRCQAQDLTDGIGGVMDYRNKWVGFFGDTLDAVVTLGDQSQEVHSITCDFYFYPLSWIFLPQRVEYYLSDDSITWRLAGLHHPQNRELLATPQIHTFRTQLPPEAYARYIRVIAIPLPHIPSWHRATGHPAWIFTDEIVVD